MQTGYAIILSIKLHVWYLCVCVCAHVCKINFSSLNGYCGKLICTYSVCMHMYVCIYSSHEAAGIVGDHAL